MENFVTILILALFSVLLLRLLLMPIRFVFKLAIHAGCGFACLWLLNSVAGYTGIALPVNAVTVLVSGFLGVPGIGLIALLELVH